MSRTVEETSSSGADGDPIEDAARTDSAPEHAVEVEAVSGLEPDAVFEALNNERRRWVLRYLDEQNDVASLGELAEHVAAIENNTAPEAVDSRQRKRAYVALYQSHLPKLDHLGVVTFDRERDRIERTPAAEQLDPHLYDATDGTRQWRRGFVEFTAVSGVVLTLGAATGVVTGSAAVLLFAGIVLGATCLAGLHAYEHRVSR